MNEPSDGASLEAALAALRAGQLVIMPTETVYGLAADAADSAAVARLYEAKTRPSFNPLIAHVADVEAAMAIADLDFRALGLTRLFWPGPLTVIAPIRDTAAVCDLARAGLDTVALRAPAHPLAQDLIRGFGRAIVAPSANRSGRPSPTTLDDAIDEVGASASAWFDGGPCAEGLESTVVSLLDGPARLLRPGPITREALEAVVGPLAGAGPDARRAPGRLARHYAPNAPVRLEANQVEAGEAYLAFGPAPDGPAVFQLSAGRDPREAAANLFSMLRRADALHPLAIAVATIPSAGLGEAINDRLRRAAGFVG